jgi:signal transduction histidine kinase
MTTATRPTGATHVAMRLLTAARRRAVSTGFEVDMATEWAWVAGRVVVILAAAVGAFVFLPGSKALPPLFVLIALALAHTANVALLLRAGRLRTAFFTGVVCDNALLLLGWWVAASADAGQPRTTDLYLVLFPVLAVGAARFGWLFGSLYGALWLAWLAWTTFLFAMPGRYDLEQLPVRLVFLAITTGLTLRLVSRLTKQRTRAEEASERYQDLNRKLDGLVAERTAQLEAANQELEAFTYSVSHDLRNPLWMIDAFSELLQRDHTEGMDAEGRRYLDLVRTSAQRSMAIVQSLLELSRIDRQEVQCEPVDLSALAHESVAGLRLEAPERSVTVTIAEGLVAYGDPGLLRIALDNLLSNAWKYTSTRPCAKIKVGAMDTNEGLVYFVRDNGVGFDMAQADKLFTAFARLHSREEFDGVGIGLTTVHRIVKRHGGRVWAEAAVDQGAVFYFTLPGQRRTRTQAALLGSGQSPLLS